jgi:hypothetical protein
MGWSGGTEVARKLIKLAMKHVPESARPKFYDGMIEALEDNDWGCQEEVEEIDPAFDRVLDKRLKASGDR